VSTKTNSLPGADRDGADAQRALVLAIDTSGPDAGVALASVGRCDTALLETAGSGAARTEDLASVAGSLLAARGAALSAVGILGAVVGPGSYTGLRSGLAFLRGLAFGAPCRAVSVGSLELLALRAASPGQSVVALYSASAGTVIAAKYRRVDDDVDELVAPHVIALEDCAALSEDATESGFVVAAPQAALAALQQATGAAADLCVLSGNALEALAALVASRAARGKLVEVDELLPVYVGQAAARPNRNRVAPAAVAE
jgi:tRNA threonylcarbamoyladenosine biosynthesis protein TsaB